MSILINNVLKKRLFIIVCNIFSGNAKFTKIKELLKYSTLEKAFVHYKDHPAALVPILLCFDG